MNAATKNLGRVVFCAWVLWSGPHYRLVMPSDAFETKAECLQALDKRRGQDRGSTDPSKLVLDNGYQCLPAGTDPRERS